MNFDDSITLNPPASTPHLVLLLLAVTAGLTWAAWRSTTRARPSVRALILSCRLLLAIALLVLVLNPGRWMENREESRHYWTLLADTSLSMETGDAGKGSSRWKKAVEVAKRALAATDDVDRVEVMTFDSSLRPLDGASLNGVEPAGESSDLTAAVDSLIGIARSRSDRFQGAIVLTDGRQTGERNDVERVALRARAGESPFFILPIGGEVKPVDLALEASRRQFVAFAGQECTVSATLLAEGLGAIRPKVTLIDADGAEIESKQAELQEGKEAEIRFTFPAPDPGVHLLEFTTAEWPEERIAANNTASFTLTVLDGKTKIFMAEGVPYWDSKFLAQMIRKQENMDIVSVYRLASDRFFRVATGDEVPSQETQNVFPFTAEELGQYDLVVLGKGVEYFLDESRLALLSEFVRDRGGAILFTRGKPYRSAFEGIEFLEPAKWGEPIRQRLTLQPTAAGEAAGLFGDLLPGVGDPVWQNLPALEESHQCLELKPFTEVLLEGRWNLDGQERTVPLLMSRRFGRGMTIVLNADGLWQWDFFPSEQGVEGQYEEFWGQLIQWAITFSEFLPGQDLSLHLDRSIVRPGESVRARIGYRGQDGDDVEPQPTLVVYRDSQTLREIPAARPGDAAVRWEAAVTLQEPGSYRVQAMDAAHPEKAGPSLPLTVLPPPSETEQLSADPEFLRSFADWTGGRLITDKEIPDIVSLLSPPKEEVDRAKAVWEPAWDTWWSFSIVLFFASLEWFTRRRSGML